MNRAYEYRHVVGFEETNLVGNVYYVNHLKWQGRCRELFIAEHAPGVLAELQGDLALATVHCACDYVDELHAFDVVTIAMRLADLTPTRLTMTFEYFKESGAHRTLAARGEQVIACMRRSGGRVTAAPVPAELLTALAAYSSRECATWARE